MDSSGTASKSAVIGELVAALKAGKLTKEQLFERLQALQRGAPVAPLPSDTASDAHAPRPSSGTPPAGAREGSRLGEGDWQSPGEGSPPAGGAAAPAPAPAPAPRASTQYEDTAPHSVPRASAPAAEDGRPGVGMSGASQLQQVYTQYLNAAQAQAQAYGHRGAEYATPGSSTQAAVMTSARRVAAPPQPPAGTSYAGSAAPPPSALPPPPPPPSNIPLPASARTNATPAYSRSSSTTRGSVRGAGSAAAPPSVPASQPRRATSTGASRRAGTVARGRSSVGGRSTAPSSAATSVATGGSGGGTPYEDAPAGSDVVDARLPEDYTFKPRITPLPAHYGGMAQHILSAVPFEERAKAWAAHREEERLRLAAEAQARELEDCTFKPVTRTLARPAPADEMGGMTPPRASDVHDRLYAAANARKRTPPTFTFTDSSVHSSLSPSQLTRSQSARRMWEGGRPLFLSEETGSPRHAKPALASVAGDRPLSRREEEELRECTFHPKINRTYDAQPIRSRYLQPTVASRRTSLPGADASGGVPLPTGLEECTFQPRTNPVKQTAMPAAAMYVRAPIFERLARTHTAAQKVRESVVADETERRRSGGGASRSPSATRTRGSGRGVGAAGDARRDSSSPSASVDPRVAEETERRLREFLARQEAALKKRERDVERLREETAPALQPQLCAKSLELVESTRPAAFLQRVAGTLAAREQSLVKRRSRAAVDAECTFRPAINPASKVLAPRSATQLSRGDQLRRETTLRMKRLALEAASLEGATFAPQINERSKHTPGRLRLSTEPDTYLQRLAQEAAAAAEKARVQAAEAAEQELVNCTFAPEVHDAPEYVKRIARSMAMSRAMQPQDKQPSRPEWR